MRNTRITPVLVGVFALATVGCQDGATNPLAPESPAFNFTNGPAHPGNSGVVRFQDGSRGFVTLDGAGAVIALHLQADDLPFCDGSSGFPVFDIQEVDNPAGVARGVSKLDEAPIFVYSFPEFLQTPNEDFCDFLADSWLYKGTHDLIIVGQLGEPPTFGWSGNGNVEDPSGAPFRYREHQNAMVAEDGSVRWQNEDIVFLSTGKN